MENQWGWERLWIWQINNKRKILSASKTCQKNQPVKINATNKVSIYENKVISLIYLNLKKANTVKLLKVLAKIFKLSKKMPKKMELHGLHNINTSRCPKKYLLWFNDVRIKNTNKNKENKYCKSRYQDRILI